MLSCCVVTRKSQTAQADKEDDEYRAGGPGVLLEGH